MNNTLSVIVPIFNEEKYLHKSITDLARIEIFDKIILVDDCSTDNSLSIANSLVNKYENIVLIEKNKNEGKGSCVFEAKKEINSSHVIFHDADLEYNPEDILVLYKKSIIYPNSVIVGSRTLKLELVKNRSRFLGLIQKMLCKLFTHLNGTEITDIASGYILMPTRFLIDKIHEELGFGIEIEILSKAIREKLNIIEVPIHYNGRKYSEGKKIKLQDGLNILFKIFRYSKFSS